MAPELPAAFNCTSILYALNTHPWGPNFTPLALRPAYKIIEIRKCTQWSQNDLNHLTVESTLYILNNRAEPQISLFRYTSSRFPDITLWKIGNAKYNPPPQITLTT